MKQVYLPVGVQYRHLTHWTGARRTVAQLLRPIYRSWLKKGKNVIVLRNRRSGAA